jgi:hypothetical protein
MFPYHSIQQLGAILQFNSTFLGATDGKDRRRINQRRVGMPNMFTMFMEYFSIYIERFEIAIFKARALMDFADWRLLTDQSSSAPQWFDFESPGEGR